MDKTTILIVEDEADIREGIRIMLSGEGYRVLEAPNGYQALRMMNDDIDLVILDLLMPGMSGFQVCEELRKEYTAPILFLAALAQERDKLTGLTAGGDDYLIKPFSFSELIARVKALLRRYHEYQGKETASSGHENDLIALNGITISRISNQVWIKGKKTELTETEYRILLFLMSHSIPKGTFSIIIVFVGSKRSPSSVQAVSSSLSNLTCFARNASIRPLHNFPSLTREHCA